MPKYLVPLDLAQNELRNAAIQNLSAAPGSPVRGQVYYDTTLSQFGVYSGSAWQYYVSAAALTAETSRAETAESAALASAESFATTAVSAEASRAGTAEAGLLPLAGGTMSGAIAMGSRKVTGLANGSAAQDAAAFGQLPSAGTPLPVNQGGTGQITQQAAIDVLSGAQSAGRYLRSDGMHATLAAIQGADVPVLNQSTTGTSANITGTLDQVPAPAANVAMSGHKLTGLSSGASSGDSVAFGQLGSAAFQTTSAFDTTGTATGLVSAETSRAEAAEAQALPKSGGTMTGPLILAPVALSDAATVLVNAALGNDFFLSIGGNRTLGAPGNPTDRQIIRVDVIQPASGGPWTLAYNAIYDFGAGSAPTLSTAANKIDTLAFRYIASISKWTYLGTAFPQGF